MISEKFHSQIKSAVAWLQKFVDRIWYPPLISLLAAADNFIVVVPTDGILISSSMVTPKRWFVLALSVALGSTIGATALAGLVEFQGLPWILEYFPGINETKTWSLTMEFFNHYGLVLVFLIAATPLMQQPSVILASLANTPIMHLALVIFAGRFLKFLLMAYLGSHAPKVLKKLWGIKGELKDAGVKIK